MQLISFLLTFWFAKNAKKPDHPKNEADDTPYNNKNMKHKSKLKNSIYYEFQEFFESKTYPK